MTPEAVRSAGLAPKTVSERYSWYVLGILTLSQTCHGIDRAIIGLVLAPVGKEFNLSDGQLGFLAGFAYGIFFALAALPFGIAVDRYNRRNLMTMALTIWSGATALCGFATGFWTLLLGRAAVGTAEAGGSPTGMSLLSDYFGTEKRSTAIGIWYLSSGIGLAIAFFVGGWIIQVSDWRWAFFAAGIPGLVLAPLLYFTVREPKRGSRDLEPAVDQVAGLSLPRRMALLSTRPGLVHCILAIVLIATGIYGMSTWLTTFLIRAHGLPIARAGLMVAIAYGVLGSVGGFAAGWIADWLNKRRGGFDASRTALFGATIPFLTAATGVGTVASGSLEGTIAFMLACGFFSASYNGPIYAVIVTLAGAKLRGLAVSMVQLGANLVGVGAGTFLIGAISDYVGGNAGVAWGIGVAMLFTLWGGIHLLLAARAIGRSTPGLKGDPA
ncbi:spinster family MFS transporter [Sphingomonas sp. KC8]|uniref:spinster family MFS transporter n=1 Tax=Sphingomonas sp. KC8 TaxID=1030157 RepID=UPI000248A78F|nr:MFS transporter [Sphingomonas sp. KC8]ARS26872.1 MFS transporter [Sphingomonas sp. KC8]